MSPYRQNARSEYEQWKRNMCRYRWRKLKRLYLKILKGFCPHCGSCKHGVRYLCNMARLAVIHKSRPRELNDAELFFQQMREQQQIFKRQQEEFLRGVQKFEEDAKERQRIWLERFKKDHGM